MFKTGALIAISSALVWGSVIPKFSGDTEYKDKSFQRDNNSSIVYNTQTKKMFTDFKNDKKFTFDNAQKYSKNLEYAEYKDWRVPAYTELRDLFDLPRQPISIKHPFKNVEKGIYWSATEDRHGNSWYVDFDLGRYSTAKYEKEFFVMCVRDNKSK